MHLIDYAHARDGVLYHGTLSDLDGEPKATWTYEKGGRNVTCDQPLDAPTFRSLWNGVGNLSVFKRNRVRDPDQEVNPVSTHVIGIAFGDPEKPQLVQFMVPADEADPEFRAWLKTLNVPTGSAGPPPVPQQPKGPAAVREKAYAKVFGADWTQDQDDDPEGPPINVYVFEPDDDRDFATLVTGGLSNERMRTPKGAPYRRAELVLYVDEPTDEHVGLLRFLAQLPLIQETTWYGPGTTMTNGNPPRPIFDESDLDCFLFLESVIKIGRAHV